MPGPTKGSGSLRRVPSSLSKVSTPPTTPQLTKSSKKRKIVVLTLSKELLAAFPHDPPATKPVESKPKPSSKISTKATASKASAAKSTVKSEPESVSGLNDGDENGKRSSSKSTSELDKDDKNDPKLGEKREAGTGTEEDGKPKSKGPQRKRPKVGENGRLDGRTAAAKAAGFIAGAHKLGPKANQGAINEKLRALDRTNKPCRKWQKTGFKIKSFTGRVWEVPSWRAPEARSFGLDVESKSESNDMSKDNSSSNVGSDSKTPADGGIDVVVSSPAVTSAA